MRIVPIVSDARMLSDVRVKKIICRFGSQIRENQMQKCGCNEKFFVETYKIQLPKNV